MITEMPGMVEGDGPHCRTWSDDIAD